MPLVYRSMKKDVDGMPVIERTASGLGIRPGVDVDIDQDRNIVLNGKGLSVSPDWRTLPIYRIPKRLAALVPGSRGSNSTFCFRAGSGPFLRESFASGLELLPDSPRHGCVAPIQVETLIQYENDLAATRAQWQVDES